MARRLSFIFAAVILLLAALAPAAAAASPRSGYFHVEKECSQYTGAAGDFCTITYSNLNAIKVGSRVFYAQAADFGSMTLDSDITVVRHGNSVAYGHVVLDLISGYGTLILSGGTGQFRGFSALTVAVTPLGSGNWEWDGAYSFSPHD
jgi:hypothetical protein